MRLYHITDKEYEIGHVISAKDFGEACYYHQNSPLDAWINDVLDAEKDADCPPRKRCIYAFGRPDFCLAFNNDPGLHCYMVKMDAHGGFPMVLTDKMRRVGQNYDRIRDVINEYWHPTREWQYNEYLGESMVIINEITPDRRSRTGAMMLYNDDRAIADRLFR